MNPPVLHLIILAGGAGLRAGAGENDPPKQFQEVRGRPIVMWSVRELMKLPGIGSLVLTCPDRWRIMLENALQDEVPELPPAAPILIAEAGDSRTASTWNALQALAEHVAPGPRDLVAIHDAARPLAGADLLARLADAAALQGAAIPAIDVSDTMVYLEAGQPDAPAEYLDRASVKAVQTPQVFRWELIEPAHRWAHQQGLDFTDDGSLLSLRGHAPRVIPGDPLNGKLTTAEELATFRNLYDLPKGSGR